MRQQAASGRLCEGGARSLSEVSDEFLEHPVAGNIGNGADRHQAKRQPHPQGRGFPLLLLFHGSPQARRRIQSQLERGNKGPRGRNRRYEGVCHTRRLGEEGLRLARCGSATLERHMNRFYCIAAAAAAIGLVSASGVFAQGTTAPAAAAGAAAAPAAGAATPTTTAPPPPAPPAAATAAPATTTTPPAATTTTTTTTTAPADKPAAPTTDKSSDDKSGKKKTASKKGQSELDRSIDSRTVPSRYKSQIPKEYHGYIPWGR